MMRSAEEIRAEADRLAWSNNFGTTVVRPPAARPAEDAVEKALRPKLLADFAGQPIARERLEIATGAARLRKRTLEHILLSGPPGLGKTTLALILANEMGGELITTIGPSINKLGELATLLMTMEPNTILFVDEVHRLSKATEEFLYPVLEDGVLDYKVGMKPMRVPLQPFTFIGATTRAGKLSEPMRDRLGLRVVLKTYDLPDMVRIVQRSANLLKMPLTEAACHLIAKRSRGTPRIANNFLRRLRDYADVKAPGQNVTMKLAANALLLEGVDANGLDDLDRRYLRTLVHTYNGGPVGLSTIAATMDVDTETLEDAVEPYLLQEEYISRGQGGR